MSRSLVQESTGGKTQVPNDKIRFAHLPKPLLAKVNETKLFAALASQIAGLLSSIVVLLVVVAIGFVFQPLPQVRIADDTIQKLGVRGGVVLVISQHVLSVSFVIFLLVTDCTGGHHHSQPGGNVQTVQRHLCSVEEQQDRAGWSVALSTHKYIVEKDFFQFYFRCFSLAGHLAGSFYSISVVGAGLRPPGGHHIRLNDSHLQNTKVPVFLFPHKSKENICLGSAYPTQKCALRSLFFLSFSPKTAMLGHIPGTGLHVDIKYEEVSSSEHNLSHEPV